MVVSLSLESWLRFSDVHFSNAIRDLVTERHGSIQAWLLENPTLLVHPKNSVDPSTFGMHQDWSVNLMPFRVVELDSKTLYVFEYHVEALMKE